VRTHSRDDETVSAVDLVHDDVEQNFCNPPAKSEYLDHPLMEQERSMLML
jgi:hypothetical protein